MAIPTYTISKSILDKSSLRLLLRRSLGRCSLRGEPGHHPGLDLDGPGLLPKLHRGLNNLKLVQLISPTNF